MKKTIIKNLIFLPLITYLFTGCVKQDTVSSSETLQTSKLVNISTINESQVINKTLDKTKYGQHTDEIQEFLSATPLGSEIYLEEKESGEWYLKIEKTFNVKKDKEKIEMIEPIYGESILI